MTSRRLAPVATRIARRQPINNELMARSLRLMFDDMGGSFTKFGQLIGSSPSLFGDVVAAEFRATLDNMVPIPWSDVRQTVEDELGFPLAHIFRAFDEEPIAAASLAAVHRAVLHDGRTVAVKVLRPDIEYRMAVDIAVMKPLFEFLGSQVAVGIFGELPSLVGGLAEQLAEEVDLRNEARSMLWFDHLRSTLQLDRLEVPLPIEGLAARRVLVMTYIDGVPVDHVERIAELGVDPAPLVQDCVKAWFATAICTGAFHGDVHAGNLLVTPRGNLGVLDWGIVGRLDHSTQRFFRRLVEGALGDETAWAEVWEHTRAIYGPAMQQSLGLSDDQMVQFVRMQVEPLFHRPFGEINVADLIVNNENVSAKIETPRESASQLNTFELWRSERRRVRAQRKLGVGDSKFDRGMFLLGKQLVYFDRYGKLFIPDVPLLWDHGAFRRLLEEPVVPAEAPSL
ncbi:MAG: AarF/ABC1/UbiB kinase family protein [Acidimicrobiales bacterium]|nr:AarF/ABC1/UbiB kinase family protein [Acidimicrobiales bacterium]